MPEQLLLLSPEERAERFTDYVERVFSKKHEEVKIEITRRQEQLPLVDVSFFGKEKPVSETAEELDNKSGQFGAEYVATPTHHLDWEQGTLDTSHTYQFGHVYIAPTSK